MAYQVIARKWRPQRFDDVVGQQAVTRTLTNALVSRRLAHAFVFAGPRGVGKTTTARILARALNCVNGPAPEPCGTCDACVEIAEGRDIDVLEIDAATHTQVDNVREVIISGLAIAPVRNRYKIFIIDEVHQLSTASFNALLKSIEEPPPHVVFMMATTELEKIPETVRSRSQVYEFRTISSKAIGQQLRRIVDAEGIEVADEALQLIARDGEGSMRDAQPRHHLEMARLRWIYLRKLVSIEDLIAGAGSATAAPRLEQTPLAEQAPRAERAPRASPSWSPSPPATRAGTELARPGNLKDAVLNEIRKQKASFYSMVVAQARTIELNDDRIVFTFSPSQKWLADQVGQNRAWLESIAQQASGRKFAVTGVVADAAPPSSEAAPTSASTETKDKKSALRDQALADASVQAMLEVFPAEIRDVEEM